MNAIIGFSELLEEQVQEKRLQTYIKTIKNAGETLLLLINDILDLSKIEAGKLEIVKQPTNIKKLVNEIASIFTIKVQEKGIDLIVDIDEDVPSTVLIDSVRVRQILINLVGNAIKFTESGYVKISMRAKDIDGHLSKTDIAITVEDTGIGIPKNQHEKIFGDFEQMDEQDNRKYGGTGLGLAISRKLATAMGGELGLRSEVGKGSAFTLRLYGIDISNIELEDENPEGIANNEEIHFEPSLVLVVDDIEDNRELVSKIFEHTNVKIITANNGQEAIELFQKHNPDLVLMDIKMPVMDGYESSRRIKQLRDVPIVALTASVMQSEEQMIQDAKFDGYLRKPVRKKELLELMSRFLLHEKTKKEESKKVYTLSQKAKENLQIVQETLQKKIEPLLEQVRKTNSISDTRAYIDAVEKLAAEYDIEILHDYAQELDEALDSFDIMAMERLLRNIPDIA